MAKLPSGRFPFINLAKAMDRGQKIFENDKNGKGLKMPVAFAAWNYSDKSSGGFQTVGALKMYGILEDEGSKADRLVRLTQEARHYYLTEIEDEKRKLRADFAAKPSLMRHLLDEWDYGTRDDAVARTHLKTAIGLNEQSARSALGIYKDNLRFIDSKGSGNVSPPASQTVETGDNPEEKCSSNVPENPPKTIKAGDRVQFVSQGQEQFQVPRVVTRIIRDPERGWFVAVQGQLGALPMEQVNVVDHRVQEETPRQNAPTADVSTNPVEIFMTADNRLQITANLDRKGLDKLRTLLDKYAEMLDLF